MRLRRVGAQIERSLNLDSHRIMYIQRPIYNHKLRAGWSDETYPAI